MFTYRRILLKSIIYLVVVSLLVTALPLNAFAFFDNVDLPLATRIEGHRSNLNESAVKLNEKQKEYDKIQRQLNGIVAEHSRLKRVSAVQLYTILLALGIDIYGALTLNPLELMVNVATQVTDYQELVTGWNSKTAAQRAADSIRGRDLLAAMIPSYESKLIEINDQIKVLKEECAFATREINRLMAMYKQIMNEDYLPQTKTNQIPPPQAATVENTISAPSSIIPDPVLGYTTALDAANSLFEERKVFEYVTCGLIDYTLPYSNWKSGIKVFDNNSGMQRWLYEYKTPVFDPEHKDEWAKSAVNGGVLQYYIETQSYIESGQTRYKAIFNNRILLNTPLGTNSLEQITFNGTLARGQQLVLSLNVEDPTEKWFETYWYAYGKIDGDIKDVYIGRGKSLVTDIPVDLYEFDKLVGVRAYVLDKFMGMKDFYNIELALNSGINQNYSGIPINQLIDAIPNQPVVMGGEIALPEYGRAELVIDYNGNKTTFETIPSSNGAIVYAEFTAVKRVFEVKAEVNVYAGSTKIANIPWDTFTLKFDKNYLSEQEISTLQSGLDAINLELVNINKQIAQFKRVKYSELLRLYALNASYATTITKHLQGVTDNNFQYTVQYALDNDKELIEYLDGLLLETGLGEQLLVNSLKRMKTSGYPAELSFIDVFYLHLKASWLNKSAIQELIDRRVKTVNDINRLENSLGLLQTQYGNSDHQSLINVTNTEITKASDSINDGAYNQEVMTGVFAEVDTALSYLEGLYPELNGYFIKYQKLGSVISATSVKLSKTTASIKATQTLQLTATVSPSSTTNKSVKWSSSNSKVAIVSSTGKVTAKGPGFATITVTTVDGNFKATCKVAVIQPVTSVKLNKTILSILKGKTSKLIPTINPSNASYKKVTWKSSNKTIATVSSTGKVKGIKKGTAFITVTTLDGKKTSKCKVTIK